MLGSNTFDQVTAANRADTLDAPIRRLPGWHLDLHCAACGEAFALELDGLERERRLDRTVRDVAGRAACPRCAVVPGWAELVPAGEEQARVPITTYR